MLIMIRCNHCGRDHRHDYCITTGKVPSEDCLESDINPSDFKGDLGYSSIKKLEE